MRKFTVLAIGFFCLTNLAQSQIKKGSVFLGGSLSFGSTNYTRTIPSPSITDKGENKTTVINPAVGIAIKNNLIFGIDFSHNKTSAEGTYYSYTNSDSRTSGGGIFIRQYYPLSKRFFAFGQASTGYFDLLEEQTRSNPFNNSLKNDGWGLYANVYPGISFSVSNSFFLETGLPNLFYVNYQKSQGTETTSNGTVISTTEAKSFGIGSSLSNGISPTIGIRFIIPGK